MSDSAKACPNCGAPPPKPPKARTRWGYVFLALFVVGFGMNRVFDAEKSEAERSEVARRASLTPAQRDAEDRARKRADLQLKQHDAQWNHVMTAMARVKNALREPESVQWIRIRANSDGTLVCVAYRARNGFGGMNVEEVPVHVGVPSNPDSAAKSGCNQPLEEIELAAEGFARNEPYVH